MRYVCVHGHFYQPPRENPWLESIEPQDSAAPYHDWNERVSAECYEPNSASRILDDEDRITAISNNYARMSFNFGPTLLSWLDQHSPAVYRAIRRADASSRERFGGHGSAMAQAYNHAILPLSTPSSKRLQVLWGVRDFEYRFGRRPEGMWLPETAVDLPTLETLAEHGIVFTVLSPFQAARCRRIGSIHWEDARGGRIDPTHPYVQRLPSGRTIAIFFYDGGLSRAVAFEGLLHRGESFAARLVDAAPEEPGRLAHIATDGESYGHHHRHGDMALAYALDAIDRRDDAALTNYGEFLERFPPEHEVDILERTAWSCAHGIGRWERDCGCHTGGGASWNQAWRAGLRSALDALRDQADATYRQLAPDVFRDPDAALDDYVELILDRGPDSVSSFMQRHGRGRSTDSVTVRRLKLLELRRHAELMYTSCGWFFSDLSGIETLQVLRYAGRVVQLVEDLTEEPAEGPFLKRLEAAKSNRPEAGNGRSLYERHVHPAKITWERLAAHYAINAFFSDEAERASLYCYELERQTHGSHDGARARIRFGRARMTSTITRSSETMGYVVFHGGFHTVHAGIQRGKAPSKALGRELAELSERDALALLHEHFDGHVYTLASLFGDEKRRIVDSLLESTLEDAEAIHQRLLEDHTDTIRFLSELEVPAPPALAVAAEVVLNARLRQALAETPPDPDAVGAQLSEAIRDGVQVDESAHAFTLGRTLVALAEHFYAEPGELDRLESLDRTVALAQSLPFSVDLWRVQNLYYRSARALGSGHRRPAAWRLAYRRLGERLSIRPPEV